MEFQAYRQRDNRLAAKFDNDLDQIVDDLQRQQRESGRQYVDRSKQAANLKAMQRSGSGDVSDDGDCNPAAR